ncbi:MAG: DUF3365 domain-containing protein [Thalassotalea sp.]|nr:DUF3365 domain-containing protein [Thalassotalea sp.]
MKKHIQYSLCLSLLPIFMSFANEQDSKQKTSGASSYQQEAKIKINTFATQLKGQLQQAIKAGGLISAIDICKVQAPLIANALSTDSWQVARTSLKVRNHNNVADVWEKNTLDEFTIRKEDGQTFKQLKQEQLSLDSYRFMQAIPTGEVCLACHGKNIDENVQKHIKKQYPKDQATGFSKGDIRGAFTLSKAL